MTVMTEETVLTQAFTIVSLQQRSCRMRTSLTLETRFFNPSNQKRVWLYGYTVHPRNNRIVSRRLHVVTAQSTISSASPIRWGSLINECQGYEEVEIRSQERRGERRKQARMRCARRHSRRCFVFFVPEWWRRVNLGALK